MNIHSFIRSFEHVYSQMFFRCQSWRVFSFAMYWQSLSSSFLLGENTAESVSIVSVFFCGFLSVVYACCCYLLTERCLALRHVAEVISKPCAPICPSGRWFSSLSILLVYFICHLPLRVVFKLSGLYSFLQDSSSLKSSSEIFLELFPHVVVVGSFIYSPVITISGHLLT